MPVELLDDLTAFTSRDWTPLVHADPDGRVFHEPRFLRLYREELGAAAPRVAIVREGGEDVAAAALDVEDGVLTFLGGFEVTDYLGPVGLPEVRSRAAKELLAALARAPEWDTADLRGLPEDGGWLEALHRGAEDAGMRAEVGVDGVAPLLDLPATWEEYLGGLPGKLRHEIRRKERRLLEHHPDARLVESTPATVVADLDRFVEMHRSSEGPKGRFMQPRMEQFFRRLGDELLADGTFRLTFLEADGVKLAGTIGFRHKDRFLLYNSAYDHAHAATAPGMVLVADLIRDAIEHGCSEFDMLKGDLGYKYRFGASPQRLRAAAEDRSQRVRELIEQSLNVASR